MPRFYMYWVWRNQGMCEQAESQLAMLESSQSRMTDFERLRVRSFRADLEGRLLEMLENAGKAAAKSSKFRIATWLQGQYATFVNHPQDAIESLTTIPVDWAPMGGAMAWPSYYLAQAYHLKSDFEGQRRIATERVAHLPDVLNLYGQQAMALAALGRLDEVDRLIAACLTIPVPRNGTPAGVMEDAAYELREHGHRDKALAVAGKEISWLRSRPDEERKRWRFKLGEALYFTEHWQEARRIFKELAGESPPNIDCRGPGGNPGVIIHERTRIRNCAPRAIQTEPGPGSRPAYSSGAVVSAATCRGCACSGTSWDRRAPNDNMLLARIESQLLRAIHAAAGRLEKAGRLEHAAGVSENAAAVLIAALRQPSAGAVKLPAAEEGERSLPTAEPEETPRHLVGQPAAPGMQTGRVRQIRAAEDLGKFQAGEVLVCDAIQPMITHLVPLAVAVVERRGGMLSHGAIIARELGLPCVNGVAGAVELLHDGDIVTVDGYLGIVTVGDPESDLELADVVGNTNSRKSRNGGQLF